MNAELRDFMNPNRDDQIDGQKGSVVEQLRQKDKFDLLSFMLILVLWYSYGLVMGWLG